MKKKQGYKNISKQLFEMEGFMIADVLAKELIKVYRREILVLTIHDSIATVDEYVEPVKSRFNDAFYRNHGNAPTFQYHKKTGLLRAYFQVIIEKR